MHPIISERYRQRMVRVLVLSNMLPEEAHPERGQFVRDQVRALRELEDLDITLYEFPPGGRALVQAANELRRRHRGEVLDVVHAHFGLTALASLFVRSRVRGLTLHGTDVSHPRTRQVTRAVLPLMNLIGAVSEPLIQRIPSRSARRRAVVLPCGVDMRRFAPIPRGEARARLGLDPQGAYLLFPADPDRAEKRYDRALALAGSERLLTLGGVDPEIVPLMINAANAVLVPSEREGFGLAVLEALACEVPVLATPVGIHTVALDRLPGTLCAPFEIERWREALRPHLRAEDPRVAGRERAESYSATRMAERLAAEWRTLLAIAG
jgi:teichuronic acid biosynthesis glycosyltransferase TuaC